MTKDSKYPSESTVAHHYHIPKLIPSVSVPTSEEVSANVTAFFGDAGKPAPPRLPGTVPRAGYIMMLDGVAVNEICRHRADRNCILGLCREHSYKVNMQVTDYDTIRTVEKALHEDKTACYGKDASIVVISPYADAVHYTPFPIIESLSCKQETTVQLGKWIRNSFDSWKTRPDGEVKHGPIWSIGTDGESSFRLMGMQLCMTETCRTDI